MFKGYNLVIDEESFENDCLNNEDSSMLEYAALMYESRNKDKVNHLKRVLKENIVAENGIINATELEKDWFPIEKFDVFISHLHTDKMLAYALAWWLKERFNLDAFVDSMIWNYAGDLLKQIDNKFCWNAGKKCYIYENRNISTAHVHMMLNCALMKMIDATECLMFLNTPESVIISDDIAQNIKTSSCWIYDELIIANMIRKSKPDRLGILQEKVAMDSKQEMPQFNYNVTVSELKNINTEFLKSWYTRYERNSSVSRLHKHPLDVLYIIR